MGGKGCSQRITGERDQGLTRFAFQGADRGNKQCFFPSRNTVQSWDALVMDKIGPQAGKLRTVQVYIREANAQPRGRPRHQQ